MTMAEWIRHYTQKLVEHNHKLYDIAEYSLTQFVAYIDEIQMIEAKDRMSFVYDVAAAAGSVMGDGKHLKHHLESLQLIADGE